VKIADTMKDGCLLVDKSKFKLIYTNKREH